MKVKQPEVETRASNEPTTDRVVVTYYTDPLCCWSWAFEPHWKKLRQEFASHIEWRYVMGGMIPDWNSYDDPMNMVSKPLQMGPVWMHAAQVTGVSMKHSIWHEDPPASSYPPSIAVKCAVQQSLKTGEKYLEAIRETLMLDGLNISKNNVLVDVARQVSANNPGLLDVEQFIADWKSGRGHEAFRADLQKTRFHKIGRFPTLTFSKSLTEGVIITGYRPYNVLVEALEQVLK